MYSRLALCLFFGCSSFLWAGENTENQIKKSEKKAAEEQQGALNKLYHQFPGESAHVIHLSEIKHGFISDSLSPARYP